MWVCLRHGTEDPSGLPGHISIPARTLEAILSAIRILSVLGDAEHSTTPHSAPAVYHVCLRTAPSGAHQGKVFWPCVMWKAHVGGMEKSG